MIGTRTALAAALVLSLAASSARAAASLTTDFTGMSQWLSQQMAQGLAFNAGSNFDPPKEVKPWFFQPDFSVGVGRFPFNKSQFPSITTPALASYPAQGLFPDSTLFPNLAVHLRLGLPWRGDAYVRLADATTPPNYKISPTMTAKVQSNSFGFGLRQHFFGGENPVLTVGGHYNHVHGSVKLRGKFGVNADGFTADDNFAGDIGWSLDSLGVDAILSQSFGPWTPFVGMGYNHTTGFTRVTLDLQSQTYAINDIVGQSSSRPEPNQGREIVGVSYDRPNWSAFANGELKALGELQYRSWIVQAGVAVPFDLSRVRTPFRRRSDVPEIQESAPAAAEPSTAAPAPASPSRPRPSQPQPEQGPSGMIFLK